MKIVASIAETVVWFNSHSLQHFVILCMEDIIYGAGTFSTELKAACGTVSESGEAPDCSTKTPYGYVYLITLPVGFYIGRKKSSKVVLDYWGSGLYVNRYIEKHGTSKLTREVLAWAYIPVTVQRAGCYVLGGLPRGVERLVNPRSATN